jgi:hypothetical protein
MTDRLARGSLPWPVPPASGQSKPVCRGSLTVEAPIDAGAKLRIVAWPRTGPDGEQWLSIELEHYPRGGRKPTAHNPTFPTAAVRRRNPSVGGQHDRSRDQHPRRQA